MENFTPLSATAGGALIGLSAVMLMALHGRIAGISGILSGAIFAERTERSWRIAFVAGLVVSPLVYWLAAGGPPAFTMEAGYPLIILGGLLVGFGTRLGSGCTSGHGVCGLSRLSPRSLASVLMFMASGMATVAILKHLIGA